MSTSSLTCFRTIAAVMTVLSVALCTATCPAADAGAEAWQVGLARVDITPQKPIWMAGYSGRNKPSEGVLAKIYAKALALKDAKGHRAVLITADVIGYRRAVADMICQRITKRTGLERCEILLNPSHTHAGPVVGIPGVTGYGLTGENAARVHEYTDQLAGKLADVAKAALDDVKPARLSYGVGVAGFVMNRREFTERGIRLGVNPSGYADRSVPILAVHSPSGALRAVLFGCACHNTTLGGKHYEICGDYAGFAQEHVEKEHPGVQAMFMIGCGADANPYPRGTVEHARQHGRELGGEVCRVVGERLQQVRGPLRTCLEHADLPLSKPTREQLEEMAKGPRYLAYNATRMLEALSNGESLLRKYRAPIAVWQFGGDLTLVGLPGEVVSEFVPMLQTVLGHRGLWVAGYSNDCFGYIPTAKILAEGGYETRCLIPEPGFFTPEAEKVLVATVRKMAAAAGRPLGD